MRAAARARAALWMAATALGGALFIVLHLSEWRHLYNADSIRPATAFGSVFYGITGLHMAHVACGIIYLLVLAVGVSRGRFRAEDVETGGLFWHFVDVVWMFVFPVVYLMAVRA
jgi:heme/copper-type cytochrome/quinol oxidase subunit 3